MKNIVACDLDAVIADFNVMLLDAINLSFGSDFRIEDFVDWESPRFLVQQFTDDPQTWLQEAFCDGYLLETAPLILPALSGLRKIRGMVDSVHVVTARSPRQEVIEITKQWLDMYGIPYDRLSFRKDKSSYCREHGIRWIIEDAPHTALDCHEHGIGVFLIDYPYNRGVAETGGIWRVSHLGEVPALLEQEIP